MTKRSPSRYGLMVVFGLCIAVTGALAQTEGYQPQVGQPGKDVVWVPTDQALVDVMLDLAKVTPADYVIDLGSGGRAHGDFGRPARGAGPRDRIQPRNG